MTVGKRHWARAHAVSKISKFINRIVSSKLTLKHVNIQTVGLYGVPCWHVTYDRPETIFLVPDNSVGGDCFGLYHKSRIRILVILIFVTKLCY